MVRAIYDYHGGLEIPLERRETDEILLPPAVTCFAKLPRIKNPTRIFKAEGKRRKPNLAVAYRLSVC